MFVMCIFVHVTFIPNSSTVNALGRHSQIGNSCTFEVSDQRIRFYHIIWPLFEIKTRPHALICSSIVAL